MKLKVKATGETLEVAPDSYVCGLRPNGNEVEFPAEDVDIIPNDWDAFRRETAKEILVAEVNRGRISGLDYDHYACCAAILANDLVETLKTYERNE